VVKKGFADAIPRAKQAEIERAQSAQALLQECEGFAMISGFPGKLGLFARDV
jgi:hypothetical protein